MSTIFNSQKQLRSQSSKKLSDDQRRQRTSFQSNINCKAKIKRCEFKMGKTIHEQVQDDKTRGNSKTNLVSQPDNCYILQNNNPVFDQSSKRTSTSLLTSKVNSFRNLLPYYLKAKFPEELAHICKITYKVDEYLQKMNQKPARESFMNLQSFLENTQNIQITQVHMKKINFIAPNFYNYYKDPLNNLIIENPRNQSLNLRHQHFRKIAYNIYENKIKQIDDKQQIPVKQFLTKRIQYFYQKKKFRRVLNVKNTTSMIKSQFVEGIINQIKQKEQELKKISKQSTKIQASQQDIKYFKTLICEIYESKKVSNMYKATLVQLVKQKTNEDRALILNGLECILANQENMKQIVIKDTTIVNFQKERYNKEMNK